ncbi:MAG: hypothetical protein ABIK92_00545 [Pseudomonadota bacterium]
MPKKIIALLFSLILLFLMSFSAWGYENKANRVNPSDEKDKRLREYTRDNAELPYAKTYDKGYRGGHDTIMNEAMLLKKSEKK